MHGSMVKPLAFLTLSFVIVSKTYPIERKPRQYLDKQ
jgi:hypothetical protein